MRLLLIRHGQTPSNVAGALDTAEPGAALTPDGEAQAAAMAEVLADVPLDRIYTSTLTRAQQTAGYLARPRGLEVEIRAGVREIVAGDLEMSTTEDDHKTYLETIFGWAGGDLSGRIPGGESGAEALGRFDEVVAEIAGLGVETVAIVSHGAILRTWSAARVANIGVEFAASHPLNNTGVITLEGSVAGGWTALQWADEIIPAPGDDGPAGEPIDLAD